MGKPKLELPLEQEVAKFFTKHDHIHTLKHSIEVANEAVILAKRFDSKPKKAQIAGYLHDISAVVPNSERIDLAKKLAINILAEEHEFPMIIHQKLSAVIAKELFDIKDKEILSAIACHTTLKAESTVIDQVVFVADKICWDAHGEPPYLKGILKSLDKSLAAASFYYINYLYKQKDKLKIIHPFLTAAYEDLVNIQ